MAQKPLSDAQLKAALDAVREHGTLVKAAQSLGLNPRSFDHHWKRACAWAKRNGVDIPKKAEQGAEVAFVPSPRLPVTADECWTVIHQFIGQKRMPKVKPPKFAVKRTQRIVVAGDFHAPFHDADAVAHLIASEGGKTDLLVISGDFLDLYSVSRFSKSEPVTIQQEWAAGAALLAQLAAAFPDILVIHGNHDERIERQLRARLEPELCHAVELLTGGNFSLLRLLAKAHPNVRIGEHTAGGRFNVGWFTQVGDMIVSHAEKFSVVPGAMLRKVEEGLADFDHVYGLQPWRVLVQAHTHAYSQIPWHADKLLLEGGCMCQTHSYQLGPRMGGRPQRRGYVTLTQDGGITDLNSVRFRWLDIERRAA